MFSSPVEPLSDLPSYLTLWLIVLNVVVIALRVLWLHKTELDCSQRPGRSSLLYKARSGELFYESISLSNAKIFPRSHFLILTKHLDCFIIPE